MYGLKNIPLLCDLAKITRNVVKVRSSNFVRALKVFKKKKIKNIVKSVKKS